MSVLAGSAAGSAPRWKGFAGGVRGAVRAVGCGRCWPSAPVVLRAEEQRDVPPVLRTRALKEEPRESAQEWAEVPVIEPMNQDATRMMAACLSPHPEQGREVLDVVRHQEAPLGCGQLQHVGVVEPLQLPHVAQGENVVAVLTQTSPEDATGDMGVQQQPQSYSAWATSMNGKSDRSSSRGRRLAATSSSISSG